MILHAFVSGMVQGVFFRATTRKKAREFGLTGYVKNLSDGRVEVYAEGDKQDLNKLLTWLHEGSKWAEVKNVGYEFQDKERKYSRFEITY